jgi:tetratricopeptide (TPR) repeat protein
LKEQPHFDRQHVKALLHQDPLTDSLLRARDWVRGHLETVVIGVLVAAALVFGVVFFINGQKQKDMEASKLLGEAHQVFQQAGQAPAEQVAAAYGQAYAKFQAVSTAYDGTPQAQDAKLGMANAQFAMGKFVEAQQEYGNLDNGDPKDAIAALASFGRARALEAQSKIGEALSAYQVLLKTYPAGPANAQAQAAIKRISPSNMQGKK